jgi:predicted dehydrogenase
MESGIAEVAMISDASMGAALDASSLGCAIEIAPGLPDLLAGGIDGLVIATPGALRAEQATVALEAGLAVFCQQPLAATAAQTSQIVEQARRSDRLLGVDCSYRYLEATEIARSRIAAGDLGDVYSVEAEFHDARRPDKSRNRSHELAAGGCLLDTGIHLVDLSLWVLRFPAVTAVTGKLYAGGQPYTRGLSAGIEDSAVMRIDLASRATVSVSCSWPRHVGRSAAFRLVCSGSRATLVVENVAGSLRDFHCWRLRGTSRERLSAPGEDRSGRAIAAWIEQLAAGGRFNREACHHVQVADVLDRIYAS